MVLTATQKMVPTIKELWKLGFGDGDEYLNFLFDNLVNLDNVLVYMDKTERIQAIMFTEPMTLKSGQNSTKGLYMYGFTIHPSFRGKGIGDEFMYSLDNYCIVNKYSACVLTPANKKLFTYYEQRGFKTQFAVRQLSYHGDVFINTKRSCVLIPRGLDTLINIRNEFYANSKLYVEWSAEYLSFVSKETKLRGGEVLTAIIGSKKGFLVYRIENNEAIITEFAISPDCMDDVLFALHKRIKADKYKIRLSADYPSKDNEMVLPFSMIKWYDKFKLDNNVAGAPYTNHVMD